ncbi:MAG: acyltransferase [Desulforhopalus sp.]|nr:acyltransferase [Desulforhopalus sp.]
MQTVDPHKPADTGGFGNKLLSSALAILAFAVVYVIVDHLVISSFARMIVDMEGPVSTQAKAYFSRSVTNETFDENHATPAVGYTGGRRTTFQLYMENRTIKKLRFDPGRSPGIYKVYAITLFSYFGAPVKVKPHDPDIEVKAGPGTVVTKKTDHLEIASQTDDPHCIFGQAIAVDNPAFRFGVPLVFAILTFFVASRIRFSEFQFWRDLQEKKSSSGASYRALDGLRGLAALLVLLDHTGVPGCDGIGMAGVVMFFCLSGFLLTIPFAKDGSRILSISYVRNYFLRRVRRIVPMFYAMILVVYVFNARLEDAIRSALFLQGNTIYWTVLQEMHFYLLLPLVMLVNHLVFRDVKWRIIVFLLFLSLGFNYGYLSTYHVYGMGHSMPLYAGLFLGGMLTCYMYHTPSIRESVLLKKLCDNHLLTLALFVAVFLVHQFQPFPHFGKKYAGDWVLFGGYNYLVALLVFCLVMSERSCAARILQILPLRLLGVVSYSFYLLHPILMKVVKQVSQEYLQGRLAGIGAFVAALLLTFVVSTVTYTLIERPFIFGKNGR